MKFYTYLKGETET